MKQGLVHLYCGDGKGKTTAAMGLCLRAAGQGLRVGIVQFLKNGQSGELAILSQQGNVKVFPHLPAVKFTVAMNETERREAQKFYTSLWDTVQSRMKDFDVLLLDEAISAATTDMVELSQLAEGIRQRPEGLEVILTGRNPPAELTELADYISEIRMVRHPYEQNIPARRGIEW